MGTSDTGARLTPKQAETLALVEQGFRVRNIADLRGTTEQAVWKSIKAIERKLGREVYERQQRGEAS